MFASSGETFQDGPSRRYVYQPGSNSITSWTNDGPWYQCQKCLKLYMHNQSLRRHLKYECGQERQFKCHVCGYRCHRKESLRAHSFAKHKIK